MSHAQGPSVSVFHDMRQDTAVLVGETFVFRGIAVRGIFAMEDIPENSVLGPIFCQVRTSYQELAMHGASPRDVWETTHGSSDGRHVFLDMSDDMRSTYHSLFRSSAETNLPPNLGISIIRV